MPKDFSCDIGLSNFFQSAEGLRDGLDPIDFVDGLQMLEQLNESANSQFTLEP